MRNKGMGKKQAAERRDFCFALPLLAPHQQLSPTLQPEALSPSPPFWWGPRRARSLPGEGS